MNILITGATGMIGTKLTQELFLRGHKLTAITRDASSALKNSSTHVEWIECDLPHFSTRTKIENIEAVIHLLGENISDHRWTKKTKKEIYDSRINSTKNLISSLATEPKVFLSASAIGFYGSRGEENLNENATPGTDFLAQLCRDWELASASLLHSRKVFLRTGLVLAKDKGAFRKMLPIFKLGLGSAFGTGEQWMSWIHINDLVHLYIMALENMSIAGPLNAVSPKPIRNIDFTQKLAQRLGKGTLPRIPEFALKLILGEMAEVLLSSQRVTPTKALSNGFEFQFQDLGNAFSNLLD